MKKVLVFAILVLPLLLPAQNLLSNPESIAHDALNNRYLVSNCGDGKIIAVDEDGVQSEFYSGLGICLGNQLFNGILYVSVQEHEGVESGNAVVGIDVETQQLVMTVEFAANNTVDGLAADNDGMLYVIDTGGRLYRIDPVSQEYDLVVPSGLGSFPQDCYFDETNKRLIVVNFQGANSFIRSVDLEDFSVSVLLNPPFGNFDGVTLDQYGNVYVASYDGGGCVYKIDDSFEYEPELISTGHSGPAGIEFNREDNILVIPNFYTSSIDLIPVTFGVIADFSAEILTGTVPLEVHFFDETIEEAIAWWWDFNNDGITDSYYQNPVWTYEENGIYDVKLQVYGLVEEDTEIKHGYIMVEETNSQEITINPDLKLMQNYPNPFNPETVISFQFSDVSDKQDVEIVIYNLKGQLIRKFDVTLSGVEGYNSSKEYSIAWNGKDHQNKPVSSGPYYYQLLAGDQILGSRKCLLLK